MPKNETVRRAPLVFHVTRAEQGAGFSWQLVSSEDGEVIATGAGYERRGQAKDAIRLIARHAGHAQMQDDT